DAASTNGQVVLVHTAAGAHNLIQGNTIVSRTSVYQLGLLLYSGGNTISDLVSGNTFQGNVTVSGVAPSLLYVSPGVKGLTIQGNTFSDTDLGTTAIWLNHDLSTTITGNTFILPGTTNDRAGSAGIEVYCAGAAIGQTTTVTIANNRFLNGLHVTGIDFVPGPAGSTLNAKVEGNDFHGTEVGVKISAGAGGAVWNIDLGGGSQGSRGG